MFAAIFTFALVGTHVAAKIPSYIHVCGRKDPNLDQCIVSNINNLKSKLCKGLPELDIPSSDPFIIDELVIFDTPNTKLYAKNVQATGLCDFEINSLRILDDEHVNVDLLFHQIRANTTYDFDIRLLVPIAQKGQLYITADNVGANVGLDMKIVTKDGKRYMYLAKIKINLDIKGYKAQYDLDEKQFGQLREIIKNFIGNNQEEIIKNLKPALEEAVSKRVLSITNGLIKHFTYDDIFPEHNSY